MYETLREKVLTEIRPTEWEQENTLFVANRFKNALEKTFKEEKVDYIDIIYVGSLAKETWIRGNKDIDIFVRFPLDYPMENFKSEFIPAVIKAMAYLSAPVSMEYASHPYVSAMLGYDKADIVPCYYIEKTEEMRSAVDRTPLHTEYVRNNISKEQKEDVIMLKQFMKRTGIYGANETVLGFSGYLCECLVLYYGSFLAVLESRLDEFVYKKDGFTNTTSLLFPDPVDAERNVASAVSTENLAKFARRGTIFAEAMKSEKIDKVPVEYIKEQFFTGENPISSWADINYKMAQRGTVFFMKKGIIEGNRESSFAQFRKGEKKFLRKLEDNGFKTIRTKMFQVDKHNVLIYEVEQAIIPKIYINKGPSFLMDDACREFAEKNVLSNIFIKEDRLCAERRREVNSIFDMKEKGRLIEPKCTEEESKLLDERVRQELTYILEGGI